MNIIKQTAAAAVFATPVAMLAACGGGGSTTPGGSTNTPDPTNTADYTAPQASFAYITQRGWAKGEGRILKCRVNDADGALADCADSGAGSLPGPVAMVLSGSYAYIVNKTVGAVALETTWKDYNFTHSIWKCSVNAKDGRLSWCADTGEPEVVHIDDFFVSGGHGYLLQRYGNLALQCTVDEDGREYGCESIAGSTAGLNEPVNFAFVPAKNRVYIANSDLRASSISLCSFDAAVGYDGGTASGDIFNCHDANASSYLFNPADGKKGTQPTGIAINDSIAYTVSKANKNVISCTIGSDGRFTACTANALTGVSVADLNRIAIQGKYAYITNSSQPASTGSVIKCEIGAGGALKSCAAIPGLSFDSGLMDADSNGSDIKFIFPAATH